MTIEEVKTKTLDQKKALAFDLLAQKEQLEQQLQAVLQLIREHQDPVPETKDKKAEK